MIINISELGGRALNYAVARALEYQFCSVDPDPSVFSVSVNGVVYFINSDSDASVWSPSNTWQQGGPILGNLIKWGFSVNKDSSGVHIKRNETEAVGETPLIAACRVLCILMLGVNTDIPDSLCRSVLH